MRICSFYLTAPQTTSHVDQHIATGLEALQMNSTFYPTESTNLIDMNFNWSDRAIEVIISEDHILDFLFTICHFFVQVLRLV